MTGYIPDNFWEVVGFIAGLVIVWFVFVKGHNKYAERTYTVTECMYCHGDIKPGSLRVLGRKGWGHTSCVEFRSGRRRFY